MLFIAKWRSPWGRILSLVMLAVASVLLDAPIHAASTPVTKPSMRDDIKLIYDADAQLCGTSVALFNRLHRQHPKAIYLGEVRAAFFNQAGLATPPWIDQPDDETKDYRESDSVSLFREQGDGYWTGGAFFRGDIAGDGKQHLVFVKHDSFGHSGDYQVAIWILKPGMSYREKTLGTPNHPTLTGLEPDVVDLVIDFEGSLPLYRSIASVDGRIGFAKSLQPSNEAIEILRSMMGGKSAQEAFFFRGRAYFSAGLPLNGPSLIYRVTPSMTAEVVCMTESRRERGKS